MRCYYKFSVIRKQNNKNFTKHTQNSKIPICLIFHYSSVSCVLVSWFLIFLLFINLLRLLMQILFYLFCIEECFQLLMVFLCVAVSMKSFHFCGFYINKINILCFYTLKGCHYICTYTGLKWYALYFLTAIVKMIKSSSLGNSFGTSF